MYWHARGKGSLTLPIPKLSLALRYQVNGKAIRIKKNKNNIGIPVAKMRYLALDIPLAEAKSWFEKVEFM